MEYYTLNPFGCACYLCLKPYNQYKLEFHATRCVFLGYSNSHKRYKCFNSHERVFVQRHLVFNENHFPFNDGFLETINPLKALTQDTSILVPCIAGNSDHNIIEPNAIVENQQGTI